jgi:membrane protein
MPVYHQLIELLQRIKLKKSGASLYQVIEIFIRKITKDEIIERANAVSFNFTLAVFPAIIFLFTLIPYIHNFIPEVNATSIMEFLGTMLPPSMFDVVASTVEDIVTRTRGGLLTFGAVFALYLATNGMLSLMRAFNAVYKTVEKRSFIKTRLIATGLTLMLAGVLILAVVLLVIGGLVIDFIHELDWLDIENYVFFLFMILRFLVIFIVFFLAISFIYYFGPAVHYNWRFFSIGSFISTLFCLGISYGFSYYINNFSTYNKLYGSLGVLIALMVWISILSIVMLVGYEINASIHRAHDIALEETDED